MDWPGMSTAGCCCRYGYDYPCVALPGALAVANDAQVCSIPSVPFRGVSCSDAAGAERGYGDIMGQLAAGGNSSQVRGAQGALRVIRLPQGFTIGGGDTVVKL